VRSGEAAKGYPERRLGWGFRLPTPSPVKRLRLVTVLEVDPDGAVSVPWEVLWALSLNEGDPVAVDREDPDIGRVRFRSLGELFGLPMAPVGPGGTISLAGRAMPCGFEPGEALLLRAESGYGEPWFTLELASGKPLEPVRSVQALYGLVVEPGFKVALPADALFALSLTEGSAVSYRTSLWSLEGWPADERPAHGRLEIEEGGSLPLPKRLWEYAALKPRSPVRFEVSLSQGKAGFRLEPDLSLPENDA
jgi:hypothetical protein